MKFPPRHAVSKIAPLVLLLATASHAQSHKGSLGLHVAPGVEVSSVVAAPSAPLGETGLRVPLELGGSVGITDKTELRLSGRFSPGVFNVSLVSLSFYAGLRQSFGYDRLKTFVDLEAAVHALPVVTLGARVAFGVEYDFADVAGFYVSLGGQLGGLFHLRISGEVMLGLQFRTYVFE